MSSFDLNNINSYVGQKTDLVIFDIGAHNFRDSIGMKQAFPHAKVYAFEPDELNIRKYAEGAKNSGVIVSDYAMSDKVGEMTFYNSQTMKGAEWTCSGSLIRPVTPNGTNEGTHEGLLYNLEGYKVKAITLESFCDMNKVSPDVIHMDVQGAETNVMKGIGKYRPKIIFSETCEFNTYETNTTLEEFDKLMASFDYEIAQRLDYDTLYIHKSKAMKAFSRY